MAKIRHEDRWDEDDTCVECGEYLYANESRVQGLCNGCFAEMKRVNKETIGRPSVVVLSPNE